MAFVLDVVLQGEAAIQSAIDRIGDKLDNASKEATNLGSAFSKATQVIGTDYAKAAAKAGAASGRLTSHLKKEREELQQTWRATQQHVNALKDLEKVEQLRYRASKDGLAILRAQAALLKDTGMQTRAHIEANMKATQAIHRLTAEQKLYTQELGKEQLLLESQVKHQKQMIVLAQERANKVSKLKAEIRYLRSEDGKAAAALEAQAKALKEVAQREEARKAKISSLRSEIKYLTSEEGKLQTKLEAQAKAQKEQTLAEGKRTQRLKDLRSEIKYLTSEEGKLQTKLEAHAKRTKEQTLLEEKRTQRIKDLRDEIRYLNSTEGQLQTKLEAQAKRTKEQTLLEEKRAQRIKDLRAEVRYLASEEGKLQTKLEAQAKAQKEQTLAEEKRRATLKGLESELQYLTTTEGKRAAIVKQQIAAMQSSIQAEVKRQQAIKQVREETRYLASEEGKRAERAKANLAVQKQLIQQEAKQQAELKQTTEALKHYNHETQKQIALNKAKLELMRKEAEAWAKAKLGIKSATTERAKAATTIGRLRREITSLNRAINLNNQATAGFRAGMAGFGTSFGMFTSSTILFASAVYGATAALRESITAGAEFEAQMDRVVAIMDATGNNSVRLEDHVRGLAETTVFTAREVSDGLMYLGMAGLKTEDALTALEPSLRLASIGMLDMGTTADIVTNIMVGMGLEASQIGAIVDDMATAITNSNMDVQQLGNAMSYVAPLAREADISLQEITASLEVLHNTGIKASRAGTAMRTSMLSLLAPTAEASEVLMKYGIQVDDVNGRMRNWTDLLTEMAQAKMTLADIEAIVGKRQAAGMKAMIDSAKATEEAAEKAKELGINVGASASELKILTQQLYENAGAAKTMQGVMEDNLRGDWLKFLSAAEEKFLEFYDLNREELRFLVQEATDFVKAFDVTQVDSFFRTLLGYLDETIELLAAMKAASVTGAIGDSVGAVVGGAAGAFITKSPAGALTGAQIGSSAGRWIGGLAGGVTAAYQVDKGLDSFSEAVYGDVGGMSREEIALANRIERYRDLAVDELIKTYDSLEAAAEINTRALTEAMEARDTALALGERDKAAELLEHIDQLTRKSKELEQQLRAAGVAREESGLFGSKAELENELVLLDSQIQIEVMQVGIKREEALRNTRGAPEWVQQHELKLAEGDLVALMERRAQLQRNLNAYKDTEVTLEERLQKAAEVTGNKAEDVYQTYLKQSAEIRGQVTDQEKLEAVRVQIAEKTAKLETARATSLNDTKALTKDLLKLTEEEVRLTAKVQQTADKTAQAMRRANEQAAKALEQSIKRKEQVEAQYAAIEYINEAYERGILLLDDEEYQRQVAIEQQTRQVALAKEKLEFELAAGKIGEQGIKDLERRVETEEEILKLLGRQKAELSEAVKFAQQQVQSLESMYSTIESETVGLLERGFRDTQSYFDSIVGSFKRMLAELAYTAAIKPIMIQMVAGVGSMMGMGSASQAWAAEQGVTVGGGMGNLASMGKSAWDFWKNGGQANVSWFNDFAKSGIGQAIGLSTAAATTGVGYSAFASAMPNTAGYFGMGATTATSGLQGLGGTATSLAPGATLSGAGSFLSRGLSYSPWGMVGALGANLLGLQGSGNMLIDTALQTGGSIVGAGLGSSLSALGSFGGPIGAIAGAVLGTALGGLFGGDKSYRMRGSIGFTSEENNKFLYGGSKQYEAYRKESAFGWNHMHINKYGKVSDFKEVIDQVVEIDNVLAGTMSKQQIADASGALDGWKQGGQRGDQNRLGEFANQRYDILMKAADAEIFRLTKAYGGGGLDNDVKSFSALNLVSRSGKGPEHLAMYAGMLPGTTFAETVGRVEGSYEQLSALGNIGEYFTPFKTGSRFEGYDLEALSSGLADTAGSGESISSGLVSASSGDMSMLERDALNTWASAVDAVAQDLIALGKSSSEVADFILQSFADFDSLGEIGGRAMAAEVSKYIEANHTLEDEDFTTANARVLSTLATLSKAFENFGQEVNVYGLALIDVTESIAEASGGLEALQNNLETYYQNFYSEEERLANTMRNLTAQIEGMDMGLPDTREAFRELVEGLDVTTEKGQEQYAQLLAMSGLMSQYYAQIEQWTAQITQAYGEVYGQAPDDAFLDEWVEKLKNGTVKLSDLLENLYATVTGSGNHELDVAYAGVSAAANEAYQAYVASMEVAQESYQLALEKLNLEKQFVDNLQNTLNQLQYSELSVMTPEQKLLAAQGDYETALQAVQDGDLSQSGNLQESAQRYLEYASGFYSSSDTYKQIYGAVFGALKGLELEYGAKVGDSAESIEDRYLAEQKRAADTLEQQLQAIADQSDVVDSLRDVMVQLPSSLAQAIAEAMNTSYAGTATSADGVRLDGVSGAITDAFMEHTNAAPDAVSAYYWQRQLDKGMSLDDVIEKIKAGDGFVNGSHFSGLASVPYDGYVAKLHRGEEVVPASRARGNSDALAQELRELRLEVRQLREENARNAQVLADANLTAAATTAQAITDNATANAETLGQKIEDGNRQVTLR